MDTFVELFKPQGRANRAWYLWHIILDDVAMLTAGAGLLLLSLALETPLLIAPAIGVFVAGFWAGVCVTIKRLHDLDRPGWHWWLLMIPLYNIYLGLTLLFSKGTLGSNQFGHDPLAAAEMLPR